MQDAQAGKNGIERSQSHSTFNLGGRCGRYGDPLMSCTKFDMVFVCSLFSEVRTHNIVTIMHADRANVHN